MVGSCGAGKHQREARVKGRNQHKNVSFVQGGYAFNRSLLSYLITHQMPASLWKMELLRTSVSECLQAFLLAGCACATAARVLCCLRVPVLVGWGCWGSVCHEGTFIAMRAEGTEPCHLTSAVKGDFQWNLSSPPPGLLLYQGLWVKWAGWKSFPGTNHIKNFKPGCQEGDE